LEAVGLGGQNNKAVTLLLCNFEWLQIFNHW